MSPRVDLTPEEVAAAFKDESTRRAFPPILRIEEVAALLRVTRSTIYSRKSRGKFDGTFCKHGKRLFFWRDRVVMAWFGSSHKFPKRKTNELSPNISK